MSTNHHLAAALVAAFLAAGLGVPGDRLAAVAAPDEEITGTYDQETSWSLDSLDMTMGGGQLSQEMPDTQGEIRRHLVLDDLVRKAEGDRPSVLARDFDELSGSSRIEVNDEDGSLELTTKSESELDGERVVFTRDSDAGTWDVAPEALAGVLRPSGDVSLVPTEASPGGTFSVPQAAIVASAFADLAGGTDALEGDVQARYEGVEDDDGARIARIELTIDVSGTSERSDALVAGLERIGAESTGASLDFDVAFEGKGELRWDLAAGRARSCRLEGELVLSSDIAWHQSLGDQDLAMTGKFEVSGTSRVTATFE